MTNVIPINSKKSKLRLQMDELSDALTEFIRAPLFAKGEHSNRALGKIELLLDGLVAKIDELEAKNNA